MYQNDFYTQKYLKYKNKYLNLKYSQQRGGAAAVETAVQKLNAYLNIYTSANKNEVHQLANSLKLDELETMVNKTKQEISNKDLERANNRKEWEAEGKKWQVAFNELNLTRIPENMTKFKAAMDRTEEQSKQLNIKLREMDAKSEQMRDFYVEIYKILEARKQ